MGSVLTQIFEPGFFSNAPVHVALVVGGVTAGVSAFVGTFTVMRGQSFAGHAFADIGTAGGSAGILLGVPALYGFVVMNVVAAGVMEMIGIRQSKARDLATGVVLGFSLGLAALFLYFDTTHQNMTDATISVLFGSLFTVPSSSVPLIILLGVTVVLLVAVLYRPLLLSSVSNDLAAVRGVPVRIIGIGYLVALALAVSLSAVSIGAILSTALLIGPAATALHVMKRTGTAIVLAIVIGVAATWIGILLSYDSASWEASGNGWPVSFCIVAVIFIIYLVTSIFIRLRSKFHRDRNSIIVEAAA